MKKLLIVSPHFPPVNAADMHRVRQSLPYFKSLGWEAEVLAVSPEFIEMGQDKFLGESIPSDIRVHMVNAYSTKYTRKLGLGNTGIRAYRQLKACGNRLLRSGTFDLVYFSTTVFACMPLGAYWKKKFGIPFVLDIQDPWRNDYFLSVPKNERPPKFWFAYRLDSYLEKITLPFVDGLIAVSQGYIDTLKDRYPSIKDIPEMTLTFGAPELDFELVERLNVQPKIEFDKSLINIVYIGRGGHDMKDSLTLVFESFKELLKTNNELNKCRFWFIGTSYAPDGQGKSTIEYIAESSDIKSYVHEITDRQPYFEVLKLIKHSDMLMVPGSNDKNYTASKLYPYILANKPMLCVFHSNSSVVGVVRDTNAAEVVCFDQPKAKIEFSEKFLAIIGRLPFQPQTDWDQFSQYTAESATKAQTDFFEKVLKNKLN